MTKKVLISPRVCTDRCLQSRAVSAALLPGELTPPLKDLLGPCDPGAAGSPHALPCSLLWRCRAWAEPTKGTHWFLRLCAVCLLGFLTSHTCRGQMLHLPDALSNQQQVCLCSFAWLVLPFPLPCCTTMQWDMSAQRPVTCKHLPVLKQEVQKIHLIALNI